MRPWLTRLALPMMFAACSGTSGVAPKPLDSADRPADPIEPAVEDDVLGTWLEDNLAKRQEPGVLVATGRGQTSDEAQSIAKAHLEALFWQDAQWPVLPVSIAEHSMEKPRIFSEIEIIENEIEGVHATVVSTSASELVVQVEKWTDVVGDHLPFPEESPTTFLRRLIPHLHTIWFLAARNVLCDRVRAIDVESTQNTQCAVSAKLEPSSRLRRLTDGILFESRYSDGVPLGLSGKPSRPLEVLVKWTDGQSDPIVVEGLPIRVTDGQDLVREVAANSDAQGIASFDFSDTAPGPDERVGLELDREALLGPSLASHFPEFALSIPFRRVTAASARVGVWIRERVGEQETNFVATALQAGLQNLRSAPVVLIDRELGALLERLDPVSLGELADSARGDIDILVTGEASSQLTSRMGSRSVYHEASATLAVYDLWNGSEITSLKNTAQSLGLGESRAAKNALQKLGQQFAESVSVALKRPIAVLDRP